jgi:hypothetical protein
MSAKLNPIGMPSSVIRAMRYGAESRTLEIAFRGARGTYRYFDVPAKEWAAFCAAGSKGTYLNEVFKAKSYRYERVPARFVSVREQAGMNGFAFWGEAEAFGDEGAGASDGFSNLNKG